MYLGEVIKKYREERGLSQQSFADACKLSKPYISQLENNRNPKTGEPMVPSSDTFVKVAAAMRMSLSELLSLVDENQPISLKTISGSTPLYEAAAGEGRVCNGYPSELSPIHLNADEWLVSVKGRSMEPTLQEGDQVVIAATNVIGSRNDIMLVKVNGDEATLKHVEKKDDGIVLIGDNANVYAPHFYTVKEVEQLPVTIEGVVVKLIRDMK